MNKVSTDQKARIFSLPVVNLYEKNPSHDGLSLVPEDLAYKKRFVIFEIIDGLIKVAVEDPSDETIFDILDGIKNSTGKKIELFIASPEHITYALEWYKDKDLTKETEEEIEKNTKERGKEAEEKIKIKTPEAPKFTSVEEIFDHAISFGATKIHIECTDKKTKIYYHVNKLHAIADLPVDRGNQLIAEIKDMAHLEASHTHRHGDFSISDKDKFFRFLVTSFPLPIGEKLNIEIEEIDEDRFSLPYLGMRQEQIEDVKKAFKKDKGIFFVVGPEGSGKTSTMYGLIKSFLKKGKRVATLENPIECFLKGADQLEVNPLEGLTYIAGFRKLLSQNYEVIMIEGIRDSQTLKAVFEASEKGKIIIAPLHDKDIFKVFDHLEGMGIGPDMISANVNLIINQRLVLRLCSNCKKQMPQDEILKEGLKLEMEKLLKLENHSNIKLREFKAQKCKSCDMTGFFGHTAIFEIVLMDRRAGELLRTKETQTKEENALSKNGIITLYQDGLLKAFNGTTTLDEISRVVE